MDGYVHPDFIRVAHTFRRQLDRTRGGAAVAVFHRGERVVDLWGGERTSDGDEWARHTLAMCFSTTKGVVATAAHVAADRGLLDYDAPVATYWPEFAQNGKAEITVRQVLSHSAGLHRFGTIIDHASRALDWDHMVDALARAAPAYPPGTAAGYHGLTFGWLVGEIVRRVSGLPIDEFVRTEIAEPLGLTGLYIGCPPEERDRIAPLEPIAMPRLPGPIEPVARFAGNQVARLLSAVGSPLNPRRIGNVLVSRGMEDVLYGPEILDAAVPAVNGFFDAVSLGTMYAMLAGRGQFGGVRLLSERTVERLSEIQNDTRDRVIVMPMQWRLGYHRMLGTRGALPHAFGHFGFGGSGGWADTDNDLALAMVCNRGTGTPIGDLRLVQLTNATVGAVVDQDRRRAASQGRHPLAS